MKIRTGFVSNSSSSSFCIIGKHLIVQDFVNLLKKDKLGDFQYWVNGETGDGYELFQLTPKMLEIIKNRSGQFEDSERVNGIYQAVRVFEDSVTLNDVDIADLCKKMKKFKSCGVTISVSEYSFTQIDNEDDFERIYINGEEE